MKKRLSNGLIGLGTVLLVGVILIGGWMLLDNASISPYGDTGTRNMFQEASTAQAMNLPLAYAGTQKCLECHFTSNSSSDEWVHSSHSTVACEDCHGPGNAHATTGQPIETNTSSSLCLTCHARLDSKPTDFPQIDNQEHSGGLPCLQCHNAMHPNIGAAPQMPDISVNTTDCLACHSADSVIPMPANHAGRTSDSCTECHTVEAGK